MASVGGLVSDEKARLNPSENSITVRSWKLEDLPSILVLCKKFALTQGMKTNLLTTEVLAEDGFGERPWFHGLLAETKPPGNESHIIIGFAMVSFSWNLGRGLILECLYTEKDWRKMGVAHKLMVAVTLYGFENDCQFIKWVSLKNNVPANIFYDKIAKLVGPVKECYARSKSK